MLRTVPEIRVTKLNQNEVFSQGEYVLYWMVAQRRLTWNFALQRAAEWSQALNKPILIFEPLRVGYPWASDRFHQFVIEGMRDHLTAAAELDVTYFPYVEPNEGHGKGLLKALSEKACVVITDEYPCFFIPRMTQTAADRSSRLFEQVDSNGLLPLRASGRSFTTAASFRRHLQKTLLPYFSVEHFPMVNPLSVVSSARGAVIPPSVLRDWPSATVDALLGGGISKLPIDHDVYPADCGGPVAASHRVTEFLKTRLARYHDSRNMLENGAASGLSAHIHFGHISVHEIAQRAFESCHWSPEHVAIKPNGSREGWWRASPAVEAFIDELVTWREIGFAFCFHHPHDYDQYPSLPDWALRTLKEHEGDERPVTYTLEQLEASETHDELWNAAQNQLVMEGRIHNYVRMLWGKKIYEWSSHPREALEILIHLNNKYALDGRDPNSYSGIFWCLGRFDRAWGPERPIYGKIRYMTSESTARKLKAKGYIKRYSNRREIKSQLTENLNLFG